MEYLGDGYAKEIIQFIRTQNFSNYLSNETNCLDYDEQGLSPKSKNIFYHYLQKYLFQFFLLFVLLKRD